MRSTVLINPSEQRTPSPATPGRQNSKSPAANSGPRYAQPTFSFTSRAKCSPSTTCSSLRASKSPNYYNRTQTPIKIESSSLRARNSNFNTLNTSKNSTHHIISEINNVIDPNDKNLEKNGINSAATKFKNGVAKLPLFIQIFDNTDPTGATIPSIPKDIKQRIPFTKADKENLSASPESNIGYDSSFLSSESVTNSPFFLGNSGYFYDALLLDNDKPNQAASQYDNLPYQEFIDYSKYATFIESKSDNQNFRNDYYEEGSVVSNSYSNTDSRDEKVTADNVYNSVHATLNKYKFYNSLTQIQLDELVEKTISETYREIENKENNNAGPLYPSYKPPVLKKGTLRLNQEELENLQTSFLASKNNDKAISLVAEKKSTQNLSSLASSERILDDMISNNDRILSSLDEMLVDLDRSEEQTRYASENSNVSVNDASGPLSDILHQIKDVTMTVMDNHSIFSSHSQADEPNTASKHSFNSNKEEIIVSQIDELASDNYNSIADDGEKSVTIRLIKKYANSDAYNFKETVNNSLNDLTLKVSRFQKYNDPSETETFIRTLAKELETLHCFYSNDSLALQQSLFETSALAIEDVNTTGNAGSIKGNSTSKITTRDNAKITNFAQGIKKDNSQVNLTGLRSNNDIVSENISERNTDSMNGKIIKNNTGEYPQTCSLSSNFFPDADVQSIPIDSKGHIQDSNHHVASLEYSRNSPASKISAYSPSLISTAAIPSKLQSRSSRSIFKFTDKTKSYFGDLVCKFSSPTHEDNFPAIDINISESDSSSKDKEEANTLSVEVEQDFFDGDKNALTSLGSVNKTDLSRVNSISSFNENKKRQEASTKQEIGQGIRHQENVTEESAIYTDQTSLNPTGTLLCDPGVKYVEVILEADNELSAENVTMLEISRINSQRNSHDENKEISMFHDLAVDDIAEGEIISIECDSEDVSSLIEESIDGQNETQSKSLASSNSGDDVHHRTMMTQERRIRGPRWKLPFSPNIKSTPGTIGRGYFALLTGAYSSVASESSSSLDMGNSADLLIPKNTSK